MSFFNTLIVVLVVVTFFLVLLFNMADVQSSYTNCRSIEALKKAQLTQAETSYQRFDATLKLLNIPKTQEVIDIRDANIAFARKNFAPTNCKRFYLPFIGEDDKPGPGQFPPPNSSPTTTGDTKP